MFQKFKRKIRDFFTPLFKPGNRERGGLVATISLIAVIAGVVLTAVKVGTTIYVIANLDKAALHIGAALLEIIFYIGKYFLEAATNLYSGVLSSKFINEAIIKDPTAITGWQITRSFANMLIVLAFVVVGIATILRLREYEAQKLLAPLIIVAILINFSPLICGVIIDSANVTMNYFLDANRGVNAAELFYVALYHPDQLGQSYEGAEQALMRLWRAGSSGEDWRQWFIACGAYAAYNWITGAVFFMLALLFLTRQILLTCLTILAPLAFASYAIPALKEKIWNRWWQEFLSWTFIGVMGMFFVYLATNIIIKSFGAQSGSEINVGSLGYLVPLAFLYIAMKITRSTSAMGASAVLGLAGGVAGFALGRIKSYGKKALGAVGKGALKQAGGAGKAILGGAGAGIDRLSGGRVGEMWQATKRGWSRSQEAMGGKKRGAAAAQNDAARTEAGKTIDHLSPQEQATHWNRTASDAEKARVVENLAKTRQLDLLGPNRDIAVRRAIGHGVKRNILEKADYRLAADNPERLAQLTNPVAMGGRGMAPVAARDLLIQQQLEDNLPSMSDSQLRDIGAGDLTGDLVSRRFTSEKVRAFRTGTLAQINQLRTNASRQVAADETAARGRGDMNEANRLHKINDEINRL